MKTIGGSSNDNLPTVGSQSTKNANLPKGTIGAATVKTPLIKLMQVEASSDVGQPVSTIEEE